MDSLNKIPILETHDLSVGYINSNKQETQSILSKLQLTLKGGEFISFIGPNGCGKSTLIKTLSSILPVLEGSIDINNIALNKLSSTQKSQMIAVLLTDSIYEQNITVYDLVSLGRYAYTGWFGKENDTDKRFIHQSIEQVGLQLKMNKSLNQLSDGERQRAMIARALAQDTDFIILDEPTAHLDLPNRMDIMVLLRDLAHRLNKGVLLSTHELGLALQASDKIWLVDRQAELHQEIPEEIINSNILDSTFGNDHIQFHPESASFELLSSCGKKAAVKGSGTLRNGVDRMLKRLGFESAQDSAQAELSITIVEEKIVIERPEKITFDNLTDLHEFFRTRVI